MAGKKVEKLRRKVAKLKKKLRTFQVASSTPKVSPLAPPEGFPRLPVIHGVRFAAVEAGVRYKGRKDVTLVELDEGTTIAGVFTRSSTRAAPVLDCQEKIGVPGNGKAVILVNSGNANAFTGSHGVASVKAITQGVANELGVNESRVFTSSTGVIGESLPHDKVIAKLSELKASLSEDGIESAAQAIMTTDTFAKGCGRTIGLDGHSINIAGIAKGSGMIAPDMATMLVYIFTDAKVSRELLQSMVSEISDDTFNCITVDSDTSTSDTLLVAATGKSLAPAITEPNSKPANEFRQVLHAVMLDLAHQVVRDGEGATKFVEVDVTGAASKADAKTVALSIANSPLVKTAVAGEDPNWGRVVMAVGKSGAQADRDKLSIRFGDILVAENGWVAKSYTEDSGANYMKQQDLKIRVNLGVGDQNAKVWTCDFTKRYIEINADYRS